MIEGHNNISYNDRVSKIFFNTKYKDKNIPEDIKHFLDYITSGTSSDEFTEGLNELVGRLKRENERRDEYMTLEEKFEEYKEEGLSEGHAAGLAEGKVIGGNEERMIAIRNMLTKLSEKEILEFGYSEKEIAAAKKS